MVSAEYQPVAVCANQRCLRWCGSLTHTSGKRNERVRGCIVDFGIEARTVVGNIQTATQFGTHEAMGSAYAGIHGLHYAGFGLRVNRATSRCDE